MADPKTTRRWTALTGYDVLIFLCGVLCGGALLRLYEVLNHV